MLLNCATEAKGKKKKKTGQILRKEKEEENMRLAWTQSGSLNLTRAIYSAYCVHISHYCKYATFTMKSMGFVKLKSLVRSCAMGDHCIIPLYLVAVDQNLGILIYIKSKLPAFYNQNFLLKLFHVLLDKYQIRNLPLLTRSVLSRASANSVSVNVASDALSDDEGVSLNPGVGLYVNAR